MRIIKSLPLVVALVLLLAAPGIAGPRYTNVFTFDATGLDSTANPATTTDSLTSGGTTGAPIFYWDGLASAGVNSFTAMAEAYITALDSDDAAAQIADTAKDTLYILLYTAWQSMLGTNTSGYYRANETVLDTIVLITAGVGTTKIARGSTSIPSTTPLGDVVYARLKMTVTPKNNEDTVGIHYRVGINFRH